MSDFIDNFIDVWHWECIINRKRINISKIANETNFFDIFYNTQYWTRHWTFRWHQKSIFHQLINLSLYFRFQDFWNTVNFRLFRCEVRFQINFMIYNITKTWTVTETLRISIQNLIIPEADQASSEIAFQVGFSHSVSLIVKFISINRCCTQITKFTI